MAGRIRTYLPDDGDDTRRAAQYAPRGGPHPDHHRITVMTPAAVGAATTVIRLTRRPGEA